MRFLLSSTHLNYSLLLCSPNKQQLIFRHTRNFRALTPHLFGLSYSHRKRNLFPRTYKTFYIGRRTFTTFVLSRSFLSNIRTIDELLISHLLFCSSEVKVGKSTFSWMDMQNGHGVKDMWAHMRGHKKVTAWATDPRRLSYFCKIL